MKKVILIVTFVFVFAGMAFAYPIAGSNNEVYNGNFDIGSLDNLDGWNVVNAVTAEFNYLQCSTPSDSWNIAVTQWIDESQNPLWLWNGIKKEISLDAQIKLDPGAGVKFRLDYWNANSATSPSELNTNPTGTIYSAVFYRGIQGDNNFADWTSVSALMVDNKNLVIEDCQPRWIKLYIDFLQPRASVYARVDSVNLTSKCIAVPEASSIMLGLMGLSTIGGFGLLRRRK